MFASLIRIRQSGIDRGNNTLTDSMPELAEEDLGAVISEGELPTPKPFVWTATSYKIKVATRSETYRMPFV
jgi:hypothetical protein